MLNLFQQIIDEIDYKDWQFNVTHYEGGDSDVYTVYATFFDDGDIQVTREWLLSPDMTKSEVIQTCMALVLLAEEHEAREKFRYRGKRIYGPHFDADALHEIAGKKKNLALR